TGTMMLSGLVRADVAKEFVFTARVFDGNEAYALGLGTRQTASPHDAAMHRARETADGSPDAIRGAKALINRLYNEGAAQQFAEERKVIGSLIGGANPTQDGEGNIGE